MERLTSVAEKLATVAPEYHVHLDEDVHLVLRDAPETSLARLKAKWQAEALGHVLSEVLTAVEADTVRAHLRNAMRKLRRQAEGGA